MSEDFYIYDLSNDLINGLELVQFEDTGVIESSKPVEISKNPKIPEEIDDFTKYNKKRTARGLAPIKEEEFDNLLETGSIESLSGSESEDESDDDLYTRMKETKIDDIELNSTQGYLNSKTAMIYMKSPILPSSKNFGIYKSFYSKKEIGQPIQSLKNWQNEKNGKSALFMIGGGHFAGAIISHQRKNIKGNAVNHKESLQEQKVDILKSKTFHRYTTRRKQGGSQSASDNAKGKAKSVGSNMRRENEKLLIQDVRELLNSWKQDLNECSSIFIRANGSNNRGTLIGYEGSVLNNSDERIKSFPFTTKRPTTSELKKSWAKLSYLNVENIVSNDNSAELKKQQQQAELLKKSQQQKAKPQAELSDSDKHTVELIQFLKKSKAPMLINYLKKNDLSTDFIFTPESTYKQTPTMLHYASANGLTHMIQTLFNLKVDPTFKNEAGRYASEICSDLNTRRAFQIIRSKLGEDYCNWDELKVGVPKTKEEFESEDKVEEEKIRKEKQQLIQEELDKKTEMELKQPRFQSRGKIGGHIAETAGLTEQQKMMLMREQRARAAEARFKKMQG
ncbi:protein Vms1p [[Candida] jaroonii]|uniref:Protein Vms1p n=1 Tax=[Candida] jaroonii TaxID=467808 RepID=A0ACA9Y6I8_9ASCO|nr:protein Vms1p [[Candida] jaroonii]